MKIVLDALGLPRFGGARSSALGWLTALAEHGPQHHYWVFVSRHEPELAEFSNLKQLVAPVANRFLVRLWAQATIPFFLRRTGADLYHATKNLSVIGVPCPVVITVNDLTHVLLARYYPWLDNMYWRWIQPFMLRRAVRIIAISESTRQGLISYYGLDERKVEVIYPCYHPRYRQVAGEVARAAVRSRYGLPESYILYVGGLGLHKNVSTLVASFDAIAGRVSQGLVLVGGNYHTSSDQALFRAVAERGRDRRIWLLDAVPEEDVLRAMVSDIDRLRGDIDFDTRNVILTLARMWSTFATGAIRSKDAAANWVLERLPVAHHPVLVRAREAYLGSEAERWDDLSGALGPCVDYMIAEIKRLAATSSI